MKTKDGTSQCTANRRARSAFTLVELLVVVAIMALAMGALLPSVKGFFDGARVPDARNLIAANLTGARNYAVANNITTALVFTEDTSGTKRRVLMYLTENLDPTNNTFTVVPGRKTTYLPDNIVISDDAIKNSQGGENTVTICFSPAGQMTVGTSVTISPEPILTIGTPSSRADFHLYDDSVKDEDLPADSFQVNYYTGTVIEQ